MMLKLHQAPSALHPPQALTLQPFRILPNPSATRLSLVELLVDSHSSSPSEDSSISSVAEETSHTLEALATSWSTKAYIQALVPPHDYCSKHLATGHPSPTHSASTQCSQTPTHLHRAPQSFLVYLHPQLLPYLPQFPPQSIQAHIMAKAIPLPTPRCRVLLFRAPGRPRQTREAARARRLLQCPQHHFRRLRDNGRCGRSRGNGLAHTMRLVLPQRIQRRRPRTRTLITGTALRERGKPR